MCLGSKLSCLSQYCWFLWHLTLRWILIEVTNKSIYLAKFLSLLPTHAANCLLISPLIHLICKFNSKCLKLKSRVFPKSALQAAHSMWYRHSSSRPRQKLGMCCSFPLALPHWISHQSYTLHLPSSPSSTAWVVTTMILIIIDLILNQIFDLLKIISWFPLPSR